VSYSIGKTSGVLIGDEEVIKVFNLRNKSIKPTRGSYELCWLREKTCLERLKGKLHFPQLIDSDQSSLSLQMTNCGESLFHTWQEHNLVLYLDQVDAIVDALTEANIQYFYVGMDPAQAKRNDKKIFPLSNFCIQDGELILIDFEMANPVGSEAETQISDRLKYLYANYNADQFKELLRYVLTNPRPSYEEELGAKTPDKNKVEQLVKQNPREVWKNMTTFTQPSDKIVNEWKKYQKRYGMDAAIDRVKRMKLATVCTADKNVVDIGCNDGYITMLVAPMVNSAVGVEPHVELPDNKPANVTWIKQTFNEFLESNTQQYDVLLSLAVSIQLRDFGGLTEQEIVNGYYSLLAPGGIVVHETQKLEDRPNNQEHTKWMLEAFATKFEIIDHGQARPGGRREYYHFRKEA
jgi:2-polyprenyl-3-methyl-5-hydroxy-6-metoxy-1,4-benzoquinol methylase